MQSGIQLHPREISREMTGSGFQFEVRKGEILRLSEQEIPPSITWSSDFGAWPVGSNFLDSEVTRFLSLLDKVGASGSTFKSSDLNRGFFLVEFFEFDYVKHEDPFSRNGKGGRS